MQALKRISWIISVGFFCALLGCSGQNRFLYDRSEDYTSAKSEPTLKIPAKVEAEPFSEEFEIPGLDKPSQTKTGK